jgi:hypothetical protein
MFELVAGCPSAGLLRHCIWMKKSDQNPVTGHPLQELKNKLDEWAEQQPDKPGRSEAIHRLVETGLEGNVGEGFFVWRGFPEPNVQRETFI